MTEPRSLRLRVANPCDVPWAVMKETGDRHVRECQRCDKRVYRAAAMTEVELRALIEIDGAAPCMQLWRRADGTVLTRDCLAGRAPLPWRDPAARDTIAAWLVAAIVVFGGASLFGLVAFGGKLRAKYFETADGEIDVVDSNL